VGNWWIGAGKMPMGSWYCQAARGS